MDGRFSERARLAMLLAREESGRRRQNQVGPEHLLLGILRAGPCLAYDALQRMGVDTEKVRADLEELLMQLAPLAVGQQREVSETAQLRRSLELAVMEGVATSRKPIGTEMLPLGTLGEASSSAAKALGARGVSPERLRDEIRNLT